VEEHNERLELLTNGQTELNENLNQLKSRLEENEHELEEQRTQNSRVNLELEDANSHLRQLQELNEKLSNDNRQIKAQSENVITHAEQLEKELESERMTIGVLKAKLEVQAAESDGSNAQSKESAEVLRLQEEMQRLQDRYNDMLQQEEKRRVEHVEAAKRETSELQTHLQKLLADHEEEKLRWNKQHQEHILSVENMYSKRINTMVTEIGDLKLENEQLRTETTRLENELYDYQNNSLLHSQIQELLQFITDEKEARETLQELASRLTGDLESLKLQQNHNATPINGRSNSTYANTPLTTTDGNSKGWGSRRMAKQSKYGRFEAQQQLDAELRAKQQILEELRRTRTRCDEAEKQLNEQRKRMQQLEHYERENHMLRDRLTKELSVSPWAVEQQRLNMSDIGKNSPSSPNILVDPRYNGVQRYNPAFLNAIASQTGSEFSTYGTRSGHDLISNEYESPTTPSRGSSHLGGYLSRLVDVFGVVSLRVLVVGEFLMKFGLYMCDLN
jgi:chromosome segregation ATPase